MKKIGLLMTFSLCALLFTGCGIKTSEYNASADNVSALRKYENIKIGVSSFTAVTPGQNSILCRLRDNVQTSTNEPFEKYIENAFKQDLKMAGIFDENSNIKISGNLRKIEASTVGSAYWLIVMTVSSSNGKSFDVQTKREYGTAILANSACVNMGTSFEPSVKQLIGDIINHPKFPELLKK